MNSMFDFDGVKLVVQAMRRLPTLGIKASERYRGFLLSRDARE
jgi:recombinational DNA repair protein RecR